MSSGIYKITSPSGKFYVGSAVNLHKRWTLHKSEMRRGIHHCEPLQRACSKYGLDGLVFEVIEFCEREVLLSREQHFIDSLKPPYNLAKTAGSLLGFKHSDETKEAIRKSLTGMKRNEEIRKKLEETNRAARGKLNMDIAREIRLKVKEARASGGRNCGVQVELALKYGVSITRISAVVNNRSWIE